MATPIPGLLIRLNGEWRPLTLRGVRHIVPATTSTRYPTGHVLTACLRPIAAKPVLPASAGHGHCRTCLEKNGGVV